MCIFTHHTYLCLHQKVKLTHPCADARRDAGGNYYCPHDPNPAHLDKASKHREYAPQRTWGAGVCASLQCHWLWCLLPIGHFGDAEISLEDDSPIEMTPESLAQREEAWFRNVLSTEQQLEALGMTWPYEKMPDLLYFTDPDTIPWQALNPRYLDAETLHWLLYTKMLPASIVVPASSPRTSSLRPNIGPHKFSSHTCSRKKPGICANCGMNIGSSRLRDRSGMYQEIQAQLAELKEKYGDDGETALPSPPELTEGQWLLSLRCRSRPRFDRGPASVPLWDEDDEDIDIEIGQTPVQQMQTPQRSSAEKYPQEARVLLPEPWIERDDQGIEIDFTCDGDEMEIDFT